VIVVVKSIYLICMKELLLVLFSLLCCISYSSVAQSSGAQSESKISETVALDDKILALMQEADIPGLSMAIIKKGKLSFLKEYGLSNTATKVPVKENTVFEAASLGKPLFGYLVLKLTDKGIIELDTPLGNYVGEGFSNEKRNLADRITARMVLSHTTGLPNTKQGNKPLVFAFTPGEKFSYSGEGILLLQQVIEQITKTGLEQLMEQHVFSPLNMNHTSFVWQPEYDSLKAFAHNELMEVAGRRKPLDANAANALHTTASDYAKFLIAALKGEGLKKKTYKEMIRPQVQTDSTCVICLSPSKATHLSMRLAWGLGWGIEKEKGNNWLWHWGDNVTYKGYAMGNLKSKDAIVYFANNTNGLSITEELIKMTLGTSIYSMEWLGYEPYNTPVKKHLKDIVNNKEKAIQAIKNKNQNDELTTVQLNWIGQQLVNRRMYDEAIAIFSLSISKDSASFPAQMGMGEAYLKNKKKFLALKHLKKALVLSPQNNQLDRKIKLLEKPEIMIEPKVAASYVGKYKSVIGVLTITKEEKTFFVELEGNPKEELIPDTKDIFISADAGVQLQFSQKQEGVPVIEITAGIQKFSANKIE